MLASRARVVPCSSLLRRTWGCGLITSIRLPDGKIEFYCVFGVWKTDDQGLPAFDRSVLATVVHEFCHSYANPVVDGRFAELAKAGLTAIGTPVQTKVTTKKTTKKP